jgi:hypothetical protein
MSFAKALANFLLDKSLILLWQIIMLKNVVCSSERKWARE